MPRQGELTYFSNIGEEGRHYALQKPFADPECPELFAELTFLLSRLPPAPARVLECGCGTGWLSYFLARRGYAVTALDVSEEALALARDNPVFIDAPVPDFVCSDFESFSVADEFDAVVFCGSLHHAEDELAAIGCAYRALKPNGLFLSLEPGKGHEKRSRHVIEAYDVGDRDMPPSLQVARGREVGFRHFEVHVHPAQARRLLHGEASELPGPSWLWRVPGLRLIALVFLAAWLKRNNGAVLMRK